MEIIVYKGDQLLFFTECASYSMRESSSGISLIIKEQASIDQEVVAIEVAAIEFDLNDVVCRFNEIVKKLKNKEGK